MVPITAAEETKQGQEVFGLESGKESRIPQALLGKVTQESKARKVKEDMRRLGEGSWGEDIQSIPQK